MRFGPGFGAVVEIATAPLPDGALLQRYAMQGAFTDCYVTDVRVPVTVAQYVAAFYTTPVFRLERLILAWTLSRPSTDEDAARLADGQSDTFSAWRVEDRRDNQLLVADVQGRTRSWFMVAAGPAASRAAVRLYFGSAVLPVRDSTTGSRRMASGFRALRGFHHLYSQVLLFSARRRLEGARP